MTERDATSSSGARSGEKVPTWLIAMGAVALVLILVVVVLLVAPSARKGRTAEQAAESAANSSEEPSPTTVAPTDSPEVTPAGAVAYVTADGAVLVGTGADAPVQLAADAALGPAGTGAVAIAPTSDVIAYVRDDAALVMVPIPVGGVAGAPVVLATDVALEGLDGSRVLAWDALGLKIAYLARGTEAMVVPQPDEPPPLSSEGVFRVPMPDGPLGNVIRVVDRDATPLETIGDPGTRSMVSFTASLADDLMLVESVIPGTGQPYSIALAAMSAPELVPTVLSADDPDFAPSGAFAVMVGPTKGGQELIRVDLVTLARAVLVQSETICAPRVSPDSTRIVYGAGKNCSRLELVAATGGVPVDITPGGRPGDPDFGTEAPSWTTDGHHVALADCRSQDGPVTCGGTISFLDPDRRSVLEGPSATTVTTVRQASIGQLQFSLVMGGPITYEVSFPIGADIEERLNAPDGDGSIVEVSMGDENQSVDLKLEFVEGSNFASGTMTIFDIEAGIDREFLILVRPSLLGVRVASLDGMWFSTGDLPVATGDLRLAIRRT